jgi:hypothetical protein
VPRLREGFLEKEKEESLWGSRSTLCAQMADKFHDLSEPNIVPCRRFSNKGRHGVRSREVLTTPFRTFYRSPEGEGVGYHGSWEKQRRSAYNRPASLAETYGPKASESASLFSWAVSSSVAFVLLQERHYTE